MNQPENTPVIVSTTAESEDMLLEVANELVDRRVAACCQIGGPVKSIYRWDGKVESAPEYYCTIKTLRRLVPEVVDFLKDSLPYDEPEVIVTEIVGGSESYIQWLVDSVRLG